MRFGVDSKEKIINHWLLNSKDETIQKVASTLKDRKSDDFRFTSFEAKVTVNGIELDFEDFDNWLMEYAKGEIERLKEEYKDLERAVQKRLEERMQKEAQPVLDKLYTFTNQLEELSNMIKPYWDKN